MSGEPDNRLLSVRHDHAHRAATDALGSVHLHMAHGFTFLLTPQPQTQHDVLQYGLSCAAYFAH